MRVTVEFDADAYERIERAAKREHRSVANWVEARALGALPRRRRLWTPALVCGVALAVLALAVIEVLA